MSPDRRRALCALLLLPVPAVGVAAASLQKGIRSVTSLPLLQTLASTATPHQAWVNGFPGAWLLAARSGDDARMAGLDTRMQGYAAIHPYFLRPGANEVRIDYTASGPGRLEIRVAALDYTPGQPLGTVFPDRELLRLGATPAHATAQPQRLAGTFEWTGVPAWRWTNGPVIADTAESRQGLQDAVERLLGSLNALAGFSTAQARSAPAVQGIEASLQEFVQASELRGPAFTLLDDLLGIASALKLADDESPEAFLQRLDTRYQARRTQPSADDEPSAHPPVDRLADGRLPPRVSLRPLGSFDGLVMELFADARLARLTDRSGEPVVQFVSNYWDGARGSPNPVRFVCDPWFRKNASQAWELAAIYPSQRTHQTLANPWPQDLLEQQPY